MLGSLIRITIDRPLGSTHPNHADIVYPINYGYIEGVIGGDGEELDVYLLGIDEPVREYTTQVIGIIHRRNDVENKLVAAPKGMTFTVEQIKEAIAFQEKYFDSYIEVL